MVGTLPSVDHYFRGGSGGIEAHFGVGGPWEGAHYDGLVYQWRDTAEQADANYHANNFAISIETSDGGDPNHPWTAKQLDSLIRLGRWARKTHNIPARQVRSWDDGGFGWHAMWGAPSEWTPAAGKTCPGSVRIHQLKTVVFPNVFAATYSSPEEDPLMALFDTVDQFEAAVERAVDHLMSQGLTGSRDGAIRAWALQLDQLAARPAPPTAAEITAAVVAALPAGSVDASVVEGAVERVLTRSSITVSPA
jgi:hypothetical protein